MDLSLLPPGWWNTGVACAAMTEVFRQHVVGIVLDYKLVDGSKEGIAHYTGFLFQRNGVTRWLTARHVIEEMTSLLASGTYEVRRSRIVDHCPTKDAEAMPFTLASIPMYTAPSGDLDFGYLEFPSLLALGVINNGFVKPLTEDIWKGRDTARIEGYWVVGYPSEGVVKQVTPIAPGVGRYQFTSTLVSLPLRELEQNERGSMSDSEFWSSSTAFYGQLLPVLGLEPPEFIEGMSGGPLFSICRTSDNQLRYHLHGVQRSWRSSSRIVRCERIDDIIPLLG